MGWIVGVDGKRVRRRGGSVGWDPYIHPWSEEARACGDVIGAVVVHLEG